MSEENSPAFYAVIPANVRYDNSLKPNAKLLYEEITALCNDMGYCWAGNEYFAKLYNVGLNTIRGWISELVNKGYIQRKLIYDENTKEIKARHLSLPVPYPLPHKKEIPSLTKKREGKSPTNAETANLSSQVPLPHKKEVPPSQKRKDNITYEYINSINNSIGEKNFNAEALKFLETPEKTKEKNKKFIPPTVEEIADYCKERNNNVDAQRFHDFYSSKGWYVGKNKMKDWKAAVRTWEQSQRRENSSKIQKPLTISFTPPNEVKPQKYGGF